MASSALKLFLLLSAVFLSRASALNSSPPSTTSLQSQLSSVRSLCKITPYPDVCFDTLKLSISVNISPNIIIYLLHTLQTALSESLKLSSTFSNVRYSNIIEKQRGTIQDCEELHQITLSALKRSASRMQEANHGKQAADAIRAYLSAALTNKNTCLEGLDSASGSFKAILVNSINNAYKHVNNCLSILPRKWPQTGRKNRRLMAVPKWMSRENSRILESSDGEEYNPSQVLTVAADGLYSSPTSFCLEMEVMSLSLLVAEVWAMAGPLSDLQPLVQILYIIKIIYKIDMRTNVSGVWRWLSGPGHHNREQSWTTETSGGCLESKCGLGCFVQVLHQWLLGHIVCPFLSTIL